MTGYPFAYLLTFFLNLFVGVSILARNRRVQANRVFFLLSLLVGLLSFTQFQFVTAESMQTALFWYRGGLPWPLVLAFLLHFTVMYPRPPQDRLPVALGFAIYTPVIAVVTALFATSPSRMAQPVRLGGQWVIVPAAQPSVASTLVIVLSAILTVTIAAVAVVHLARAANQVERRQRVVVLVGVLVGLLSSIVAYAVLPTIGIHTPDVATFGFGLGCVILGVAVLKYRLFTLDVVAAAEQIVRDMPSALILLDPEGVVVRVNEAAHELAGIPPDALPLGSFLDRFPDHAKRGVQEVLRRSFEQPGVSIETEILGTGLMEVPVSLTFSPVTDEKGEAVGTVCLGRDLRPDVQTEAEKRRLEERLRQSEKMEAIGRLAGGVAHDFNNILAGILGYADLITSHLDERDDKLKGYVEKIVQSSKRAARLVANLLTFARKKQLKLEPVDLHRIALQVVELLEHSIDKRIEVSLSLDVPSPLVMADAAQLHNAVLNLALNARDAIVASGTIKISTSVQQLDEREIARRKLDIDPGRYILLSVDDTGAGISSESIDRIFDPFFTTKEVGHGTGLGLASVHGTAHACHGTVTAQSREGQGTTLTLYLPAVATRDEPAESDSPAPAEGKAFILVIDDEKFVRDVISVTLQTMGYGVHCSPDGDSGVEFLTRNISLVDLVILDLNMPGQSGYEVFNTLKDTAPDLPVVISTGLLAVGESASDLNHRAAGFLQKPFGRADLAAAIEGILNSGSDENESARSDGPEPAGT